jgi:outer membrane immunogenic protein
MRLITAAVTITLASSVPAMAQEVKPFEGASVTAIAGADATTLRGDKVGFVFGGQVGYDWQAHSLVLGLEAEATGRTRSGCYTVVVGGGDFRSCDKGGRDFYIGGKVGVALSDATLLYAKGGYTNRRDNIDRRFLSDGTVISSGYSSGGFRVGAGLEQRVAGPVSLKVEYRFSNYSALTDIHQAVAGLGIRF